MRSTQFDYYFPIGEAPEEHHRRNQPDSLCETLKRLGYAAGSQVRLYGERFDLLSDPVRVNDNFVFVDAMDQRSGRFTRVRIPRAIIQMARIKSRAA